MSFDGNGNYTVPTGTAAVSGEVIDSAKYNTLLTDLQTALTKCLLRDGQGAALSAIPMGGFKITGLAAATAAGDALRYEQLTDVLGLTQNAQSGNYTLVLTDAGKHVYSANAGAQTVTVPTNAAVAFPLGTAITLVNNGTTAITLTTTSLTVYKAGVSAAWASGGTLAPRGLVTWLKVGTDTWFVSGSGLST